MDYLVVKDLIETKNKKIDLDINLEIDLQEEYFKTVDNVKGHLSFSIKDTFIIVKGNIKASLEMFCDRCANDFNYDINVNIDEIIEINDYIKYPEELEIFMDSAHEVVSVNDQIKLDDFISQYIILSIPTKRVCSNDCINSTIKSLGSKKSIDPRWEKLLMYKDNIKGD